MSEHERRIPSFVTDDTIKTIITEALIVIRSLNDLHANNIDEYNDKDGDKQINDFKQIIEDGVTELIARKGNQNR